MKRLAGLLVLTRIALLSPSVMALEPPVPTFADVIKALHAAEEALRSAQAQQQDALMALNDKEGVSYRVMFDDNADREIASSVLVELRARLENAFTRLVDAAQAYDQQYDKVHDAL